jgi:1-deoxy-D-xylulose-5-phosphate synthase
MNQNTAEGDILHKIQSPTDLRKLNIEQLKTLPEEMRQQLVRSLNQCGGHFGANLGSIELTIALHYLYNTPHDKIIWDVGHQAYPHKMLTGRCNQISSIKHKLGLSPFPKRTESEYDTFGVGHSSTSIGAGVGMSIAAKLQNQSNKIVSVIGDGGLTGGMALEALNHAGGINTDILVILNDNEMSISENVGALTKYFARILSGKLYQGIRENSKKLLSRMPRKFYRWFKRSEMHVKGMIIPPGTLFEELGFNYYGPMDGHDLPQLINTLKHLQQINGPKLLHIKTVKGKGYAAAEADPIKYHAVKPGFANPEKTVVAKDTSPTYANIFGQWLCDMAAQDEKIVGITPAMREGSDLINFSKSFPDRYFDVGIAEQHAVTLAAGMACEGLKPVVAIYSTFLQRAYDQLIHDVAIQNLDVTFAIDRAGLVGPDGPTHAGSFDLSYLRCIPNMVVMAPANENECRQMLFTAYQHTGPAAVRYPRGKGTGATVEKTMQTINIGEATYCRHGQSIAILSFGTTCAPAIAAAEKLNATVVNMRFIKPLDKETILKVANNHSYIVTIEDNAIMGGAGSAVIEFLQQQKIMIPVLQLGIPDTFIQHQTRKEMLELCKLDCNGIIQQVHQHWPETSKRTSIA